MNSVRTGRVGERISAQYLKNNGFEVLALNWRIGRLEVDIIAFKDSEIHIVEVKTLTNSQFKEPFERVDALKRKRIIKAARGYLQCENWRQFVLNKEKMEGKRLIYEVIFDVMSVTFNENMSNWAVDFFPDAFSPSW